MKRIFSLVLALLCAVPLCACGHTEHIPGAAATCTEPQVCLECGEVIAPALGHKPGDEATCTEPQLCTVCGAVLQEALGHKPGEEATCTEPQVCLVCGEELTPALGHEPGDEATCTENQVCKRCGEVLQEAFGHKLNAAGACTVCGKQISAPDQQYTPGKTAAQAPSYTGELIPESQNTGHYHNDLTAYMNGTVLICGDYGMEYVNPGTAGCAPWAEAVNAFAAKYPSINVTALITPKCAAFQSPSNYANPYENTVAYINNTYALLNARVKKADAIGTMTPHAGEYMFYRTDHHWTGLGAYYASVAYCEANGITPYALDSYATVVAPNMIGSLYGYSGNDANLKRNPDYTVGHYPHTGYLMSYSSGGAWYKGTAINPNSNQYWGMFMCGDQPLTVVETDNKNGKALLIFKESYGNAFAPYMIDYYEKVVVVDIRKDSGSIASIIERYGITDTLFINNLQAISGFASAIRTKALS